MAHGHDAARARIAGDPVTITATPASAGPPGMEASGSRAQWWSCYLIRWRRKMTVLHATPPAAGPPAALDVLARMIAEAAAWEAAGRDLARWCAQQDVASPDRYQALFTQVGVRARKLQKFLGPADYDELVLQHKDDSKRRGQ